MQNLKYRIMKINRVYVPYWEWEDYLNGMWRSVSKDEEFDLLQKSIKFTSDWVNYGNSMSEVIKAWPKTMINSMTNSSINKRAFLGHCAVQFKINCPEYITRAAWKELTDKQRFDADLIAQQHIDNWIKEYERKNRKVHKGLGEQLLLQWVT
jgi:hypothetical protein